MPFYGLTAAFLQRIAWLPLNILFRCPGRFTVTGSEHVRAARGPVIFASNHISELDPLLLVAALPFFSRHLPLSFVSREKGFYSVNWRGFMYGGTFFRLMGAHPAYVGLHDYGAALRHHIAALENGQSVSIFPMGGIRPRNGVPLSARGGVAYLAHTTGVPIIPVRITEVDANSSGARHMTVTFGAPIKTLSVPNSLGREECEAAAKALMEEIDRLH